jgi:dipeptidase E
MQNTNDMPIIYPKLSNIRLIPFNINAHYLDPDTQPNIWERQERPELKSSRLIIPVLGLEKEAGSM